VVVAMSLVAGACGRRGPDPLEIGVKRIALDLAFKDESKAPPPEPAKIIEVIGLPEDAPVELPTRVQPTLPGYFLASPCPEAQPDAFPKEPVTIFFRGAPKAGIYGVHGRGTIKLTSGALTFTLPFPPRLTYEVKNVTVTPSVPPDVPNPLRDLIDQGDNVTYDLVKTISPQLIITDSYHYTRSAFTLTKRVTVSSGVTTTFTPTPPITLESMTKGDGDTWSSAGSDQANSVAMVVQGAIEKREFVDVCGQRYDAWKVNSTETAADLATGAQTGTDPQQPNIYRFANHLGGLVISEEGHFTQALTVNGSPVTAEWDYTSTFDSVEPKK
jgi:hypothetical protein